MNYILKNARVIDPSAEFDGIKDIYVTDGYINSMEYPLNENNVKMNFIGDLTQLNQNLQNYL